MAGSPSRSRKTSAAKLTGLEIVKVPLTQLRPDPFNERRHPERNLAVIEASLTQFGQLKPLVVTSKMVVVSGNGTLEVMRHRLGWQEAWVTIFPGNAREARAYAIADNRSAELATWNDRLAESLATLTNNLITSAGFTPDAAQLLSTPDLDPVSTDPFNIPAPKKPVVNPRTSRHSTIHVRDEQHVSVAISFPQSTYQWIKTQLGEYRDSHGLDSVSDALLDMLESSNDTSAA